jgi:hypothetical protein
MDVEELDATILSHARAPWLKTAAVAARTMQDCGLGLSDEQFDVVVARVRVLVARGRLVAKGNLSRPRFSEVRPPGSEGDDGARRQDLRR